MIIGWRADHQDLAEVAAKFLAENSSSGRVRAVVESDAGVDRELDAAMAGLGWFGIEIPAEFGGAGASFAELAVLLEVMGAHLASSGFLSSAVLCAGAVLVSGTDGQRRRWLPGLASGKTSGAIAVPRSCTSGGARVTAVPRSGGWRLSGTAPFVLNAPDADLFIVDADAPYGRFVLLIPAGSPGITITRRPAADGTRCLSEVGFTGVAIADDNILASGAAASSLLDTMVNRAAVALAADSAGLAARVLEMTTSYIGQREQFGRPIGSFQAVKHRAADMLVETEAVRGLTGHAAESVRCDPVAAGLAASMAKEYACATGVAVAGAGIQLHGGIGYTWEHDLHLYLKRAALNEALFGDGRWHRQRAAHALLER
ncbi:MAG TPA: acyl-CoA dehydrogenase family protein [Amycolatopsis sp.]|nr:acyl-CoA dehydrogenase family protein [Amycolatopsis sp.]